MEQSYALDYKGCPCGQFSVSIAADTGVPGTVVSPPPNQLQLHFIEVEGSSEATAITAGCTATVHAKGVIQETGKKFWSTKDPGQQSFTYQTGVGG